MASFDQMAAEAGVELTARNYSMGEIRMLMTATAEVTRRECREEWNAERAGLLAALSGLAMEFESYSESMREFGRGHEDYGGQREAARAAIAHAENGQPATEPAALAALREINNTAQEPCPVNRNAREWAWRKLSEVRYIALAAIQKNGS